MRETVVSMGQDNVTALGRLEVEFGLSLLEFGVLALIVRGDGVVALVLAGQLEQSFEKRFDERTLRLAVRVLVERKLVVQSGGDIAPTRDGKALLATYMRAVIRLIDAGRNLFAVGVLAKLASLDFD